MKFMEWVTYWTGLSRDDYARKKAEPCQHLEEVLAKFKGDPVEALRSLFETGEYLKTDMELLNRLHLLAFAEQNHFKIKVEPL